ADSLLFAGHQPELFHPGVWLKNFALHRLAREQGVTPLNLIVDNDTMKSAALRIPIVADGETRLTGVLFDGWTHESPYEERVVHDESLWHSFAERVGERTGSWPFRPMLAEFWPLVMSAYRRDRRVG